MLEKNVACLSGGFMAFLAGILFDHTGSYQTVLGISTAMTLLAIVCGIFIREERHFITGSRKTHLL